MPSDHVVVAMSGGVDSSVAALLLVRAGLRVTGVTIDIRQPSDNAAAVCAHLGIEHYVVSLRELFEEQVIAPFVAAYAAGRTPNPCIQCNRVVKWGALFEWARQLGASKLATGHYARIFPSASGYLLGRGVDIAKDQSYLLYTLSSEALAHTIFPLGEHTKVDTRRLAAEAGLSVADHPESQEICFLLNEDYRRFLEERAPEALKPGPILDRTGHVLGEHQGLAAYTIGQRRGLGLPGGPWYVVAVDPARNAVIVGRNDEVFVSEITVSDLHLGATCSGQQFEATVMTRYRGPESPATITLLAGARAQVRFHTPHRAPAPGQAAVFYCNELVLGGGTIE